MYTLARAGRAQLARRSLCNIGNNCIYSRAISTTIPKRARGDKVSREDIINAINAAESQLSGQILVLDGNVLSSEERVCAHVDSTVPSKSDFNAFEQAVRTSLAQSEILATGNRTALNLLRDVTKSFEARISALTSMKEAEGIPASRNDIKALEERISAAITALQEKTKNTLAEKIEENKVDLAVLKEENKALKEDNVRLADHLEHISWKLKFLPFKVFVLTAASCAVSLGAADYFDYVFHFTTLAPREGISELFSQWIYGPPR